MNYAILIVIDGCRPDALSPADTPNVWGLMESGAATLRARTVTPALTLPVHWSLFTGTPPSHHGVQTNAPHSIPAPGAWSLIDLVRCHGGTAAAFFSWEALRGLYAPGAVEMAFCRNTVTEPDHDLRMAEACAAWVVERQPNFVFLYLERTDFVGHTAGWMSRPYQAAVTDADRAVGRFLAALEPNGLRGRYGILLQSDHGGFGRGHEGMARAEVLNVPWMVAGPGIRVNHRLVSPVGVLDTAPTLARILAIPSYFHWAGTAVDEAWEGAAPPSFADGRTGPAEAERGDHQ